jgi:hypothetical protein
MWILASGIKELIFSCFIFVDKLDLRIVGTLTIVYTISAANEMDIEKISI